jgi:hypothetical protein
MTSVKVVTIRGEYTTKEIQLEAQVAADSEVAEIEPQDKEHVEDLIRRWADAYESTLRKLGCRTHRMACWRKMDLTSIQPVRDSIEVKSPTDWRTLTQEYLWPRETAEI